MRLARRDYTVELSPGYLDDEIGTTVIERQLGLAAGVNKWALEERKADKLIASQAL